MSDCQKLDDSSPLPKPETPRTNWPALAMGLLLSLSSLTLMGIALLLAGLAFSGMSNLGQGNTLTLLMMAAGTFALGALLMPGAYLNARKFFNLPEPRFSLRGITPGWLVVTLLVVWVISLAFGNSLVVNPALSLFVLPVVNVIALTLPMAMVLVISLRGLSLPSPRRAWSIFGASAVLGPTLAIFFELLAFVSFALLFMLYANWTPGLQIPLRLLLEELQSETGSMEFISQQAVTLLLSPGAALFLLGLFALAVPVIEEAFKVFLLWFYAGRMRSPVEGFVAGALCGAAFALAENIGFSSVGAEGWLANVLTRATAILPHVFNSGLVGWGLVMAWQRRGYVRLGLAYLAAVLVHGAWNALSVALALNSISGFAAEVSPLIETPLPAAITWGVLVFGILLGLFLANRQMRRQAVSEAAGDVGYNLPPQPKLNKD
ncbi:MAG: hypothetical protein Fur0016_17210 [Anaerolineales bacterium]